MLQQSARPGWKCAGRFHQSLGRPSSISTRPLQPHEPSSLTVRHGAPELWLRASQRGAANGFSKATGVATRAQGQAPDQGRHGCSARDLGSRSPSRSAPLRAPACSGTPSPTGKLCSHRSAPFAPGRVVGSRSVSRIAASNPSPWIPAQSAKAAPHPRRFYSSQGPKPEDDDTSQTTHHHHYHGSQEAPPSLRARMVEAAATSFASILVLAAGFGLAGYAYHKFYKHLVLKKMMNAFTPGDPVLELAAKGKGVPMPVDLPHADDDDDEIPHWVERPEQVIVDDIVSGRKKGHYYLFIGEKGTGKSSMLLDAMHKIDADGVAMFEAHADLEIFRIRLGKALDYEYHEDYIGGYFSERGPRESTALLDIERALNKLEKVALRRREQTPGRPLVLILNQMHLIRDDDDGKDLFELLQQRAEQWAAANLVTMVFNSDDYWVYERFKQLATRLEVLSITDLPKSLATNALKNYRHQYHRESISDDTAEKIYDTIGGRLSFLNRVARSRDMLKTCQEIVEIEKTWFLNQCWILGETMDDDVMDQQKWAAAAMTLALGLVDKEPEMEQTYDPVEGHVLPSFALHEAQELMTRSDFIRNMDRLNLFTITSEAQVRASSVPMHIAFRQICSEERFRNHLEETNDRIAAIESLGRTRELVAKDLVLGSSYEIKHQGGGLTSWPKTVVKLVPPPEEKK